MGSLRLWVVFHWCIGTFGVMGGLELWWGYLRPPRKLCNQTIEKCKLKYRKIKKEDSVQISRNFQDFKRIFVPLTSWHFQAVTGTHCAFPDIGELTGCQEELFLFIKIFLPILRLPKGLYIHMIFSDTQKGEKNLFTKD